MKIEAHGTKGKPWRHTFESMDAFATWLATNEEVTIQGIREIPDDEDIEVRNEGESHEED